MSARAHSDSLDWYLELNDHNVRVARYLLAVAVTPILILMGNTESIASALVIEKVLATMCLASLFLVVVLLGILLALDIRLSEHLRYAAASAAENGASIEGAVKDVWDSQTAYPRAVKVPILAGGALGYGSLVALICFRIWL